MNLIPKETNATNTGTNATNQYKKPYIDGQEQLDTKDGYCNNKLINIENGDQQLVLFQREPRLYRIIYADDDDDDGLKDEEMYLSKVDRNWSRKILEMVGNKAKLMESFSWLSTVGGGFSALGERDSKFSLRAGTLSLGQQLQLAELLGDERLKVMCHLFAALAALQLDNKQFCINYIRRIILPLIGKMPYQDQIVINILKHICFRMAVLNKFVGGAHAIENGTTTKTKQGLGFIEETCKRISRKELW